MRFAAALFFAALLGLVGPSFAADDPKTCAMIPEDKYRLACYDRHFREPMNQPVDADMTPDEANETWRENWRRKIEKSGFDDSKKVILFSQSTAKYESRFKSNYITLVIACRENTTSLWFNFGGLFMSDLNNGKIDYRIDKRKPGAKNFRESNNHEALGLWSGSSSIPFIKQLFGAQTLLIRATPHSESAVTGEFKIGGLEYAIKPLREACSW